MEQLPNQDDLIANTNRVANGKLPKKVLTFRNFNKLKESCDDAMKNQKLIAVVGEPGFGKTTAFQHLRNNRQNVVLVTVKRSMTTKQFWTEVHDEIYKVREGQLNSLRKTSYEDEELFNELLSSKQLFDLTERQQKFIHHSNPNIYQILKIIIENMSKSGGLLIFDEAGRFHSPTMLEYVHELKDSLQESTGIVLAGPGYWKRRLLSWSNKGVDGVPELVSRINYWVELERPGADEIKKMCESYGIFDPEIIREVKAASQNFRIAYNKITEHLSMLDN